MAVTRRTPRELAVEVGPSGLIIRRDGADERVALSEIFAAFEHDGDVYALLERAPGESPWLRLGQGGRPLLARLAEGGGYRDAMRRRRQGLGAVELRDAVLARHPVAGALEVPCTLIDGLRYPGLVPVQLGLVGGGYGLGLVAAVAVHLILGFPTGLEGFVPMGTAAGGAAVAHQVGKRWRSEVRRNHPGRKRVLVLAPDGCVAGFVHGVTALAWSDVGRFESGPVPE